ncbi:hypothetical protein TEA_018293 [Camellia sinensis var. sinensis]|uniref:Uncharacterized protein n=1 Tax=Camellia sinensis var. sinensis TaxID=542762 RepID=A0A4V3WPB1_CAMSN|nr:hypothetical protein TEA_018293 [Camellia sinensis var. sinensis]
MAFCGYGGPPLNYYSRVAGGLAKVINGSSLTTKGCNDFDVTDVTLASSEFTSTHRAGEQWRQVVQEGKALNVRLMRTPHSKLSVQTSTRLDCDGARFGNWDVEASQFHEKHWMVDHHTSFVKPRMVTNNALIQDFDGTLVLVVDFPQEGPNTSDYAIFICFIIRQYVHRVEIDNTIDGLTQSVLRAMMVKMFMINPTRGRLRGRIACYV